MLGAIQGATAGGGPENVLLVVNANSPASLEVANHYARLRDLPAVNVVHLDYKGPLEQTTGEVFREQILRPAVTEADARGLGPQIDVVAYSVDFPWRIDLEGDSVEAPKLPAQVKAIASITGATFYYQLVLPKSPVLMSLDTNWYAAPGRGRENLSRCVKHIDVPTRGFRGRYAWSVDGVQFKDPRKGPRYLLSTMLGVTTGRGNTVAEVVECLRRASLADNQPPQGTFYFARNGDVRSSTRHDCYEGVAAALRGLGSKAVVVEGHAPEGAKDVAGMMLGIADVPFDRTQPVIQPGAICEHLTSFGGHLMKGDSQTSLAEWIRAGAAGSSGTVYEPYAIQAKFPLPSIHLHYRRGASLAEAFYQSVTGPYQLLIVGDPLCQPWAVRPKIEAQGWPGATTGSLGLPQPKKLDSAVLVTPRVTPTRGTGVAMWELFLDGRLRMRLPSGTPLALRPEELGPGRHELRLVGANPDPIESQRRIVAFVDVSAPAPPEKPVEKPAPDTPAKPPGEGDGTADRTEKTPPAAAPAAGSPAADRVTIGASSNRVPLGGRLRVRVGARGASAIVVRHQWREVGRIEGDSGEVELSANSLGRGPVRLQAFADPGGAPSPAIWVTVE
jgi:hypothetical protein